MAEGIGVDGLHCISGTCDLCGEACDANTQELNVLSCTFKNCEDLPYHQDCLEKYLKSIRLERNRKTGFKCPRGCGKGTKHPGPCPGKIDKSHPIHPRNEEQKKKKKANLPQVMAAAPVRVIKTKEEKKAEKEKAKAAAAAEKAKAVKAAAVAKPAAMASSSAYSAASSSKAKQPPQPDPKKLAEAAAALKREIAANKANKQLEQGQQQRDPSPSQPEYKTLDAYLRENSASSSSAVTPAAPVVNAWAKPPAPTPASHALSGAQQQQQQQRHRPAEPTRLPAAATARDLSPVSPAATATTARVPPAGPGRPAAAAAGAGLPPMPQPPPPPPPPAAAQQVHGMHHVPSIHSHPLTSQGSTVSLMSQASAGANGQLPVGAEYVGDEAQLTKAQRKNLKRAEKKKQKETGTTAAATSSQSGSPAAAVTAAAAVSPGTAQGTKLSRLSVVTGGVSGAASAGGSASLSRRASSTSDSLAAVAAAATAGPSSSSAAVAAAAEPEDAESVALMHELAVHALLAKKTLALVASLQRLGFAEWQAAAAVQRHGSDLEDAVAWLLDGGAPDPEAAAAVSAGCVADVSIVEELRLMEALGTALPQLPRTQLYIAVADAGGDLDKAAATAMAQHAEIVAAAEAAAAAAANSPLASVSITASPTSTTSAQQVQQAQKDHLQQHQQPQMMQQQQQLSNGIGGLDASQYSAFGGPSLSLYGAASAAPSTLAPAAPSVLPPVAEHSEAMVATDASSSGFGSWFNPAASRVSTGLGAGVGMGLVGTGLTAHPLTSLTSTSSLGVGALESTGSGFGSYAPGSATAAAAAAMGSNIWGAGSVDAASSAAGWGQLATSSAQPQQTGESLSGSLFAHGGLDSGLGGWGSAGGLAGGSGLGLLGNNQGSSSAMAEPALNPYAPFGSGGGSSLFASSSLAAPAAQPAVSTPGAGDAGLQQSRLFSSYGVSQPSLFGSGAGAQPQQQQGGTGWGLGAGVGGGVLPEGVLPETAPSAEDDDLEGLLATLMCH